MDCHKTFWSCLALLKYVHLGCKIQEYLHNTVLVFSLDSDLNMRSLCRDQNPLCVLWRVTARNEHEKLSSVVL